MKHPVPHLILWALCATTFLLACVFIRFGPEVRRNSWAQIAVIAFCASTLVLLWAITTEPTNRDR